MPRSSRLSALMFGLFIAALACGQATVPSGDTLSGTATALPTPNASVATSPSSDADTPILIGTEYVIIEIPRRVAPLADMLAPLGLTAAKPLPENFTWGRMQRSPDAAIDFTRLDEFVKQFQSRDIDGLVLGLRSLSDWASKDVQVPGFLFPLRGGIKEEYLDEYQAWITAVVERYDADGVSDMPGLQAPLRYYEIGVEFSSYEPEPVDEYLNILQISYEAAHAAYPDVLIAHVPFLTTPALNEIVESSQYPAIFDSLEDQTHSLADIRAVLDHPEWFDVLNIHSLGHPYEIEAIVAWLTYETGTRGYAKPIMISDTGSTPFIAWGPATECDRPANQMGRLVPPATEADRCRLADYFTDLVNGDVSIVQWTREFIAQDTVKRVVVAAEQDIVLIDTAFTEDLLLLRLPIAQAGAGTAAWAGLVDFDLKQYRPVYFALQQLIDKLGSYDRFTRIPFDDDGLRLYEIDEDGRKSWIAWYDPATMVLPGDAVPQATLQFDFEAPSVTIENLALAQSGAASLTAQATGGLITITLGPSPVFISPTN